MISLHSADQAMSRSKPAAIPADVYIQFVRSLFNSVHTVLVGTFIHTTILLVVFWKDGSPIYAGIAVALFGIGIWRYARMLEFTRSGTIADEADAQRWERSYLFQGTVQALAIGFFCFTATYLKNDPFAEMAAVFLAFGSLVTVAGRNYGSQRMVLVFSTAFIFPIGIGLILHGEAPYILLGLVLIPFFLIVIGTAAQIREVLFSAVIGHRQAGQLAQRFNRALNTMPHGLVMLDSRERVAVANAEASHIVAARSPDNLVGRSLKSLMMRSVAAGLLDLKDCNFAEAQLTKALREGRDRKLLLSFKNGRHLELSSRAGGDELGVVIFEDVTARVEAEEKVRFMARFDSLTGLANRAFFHEMVTKVLATGNPLRLCGLVVFDLDDFKTVNDTLGHPVGDGLIYAIAERLNGFAKEDVIVSRFGGDEFMVFFDNVTDEKTFEQHLAAIFTTLQGEVDIAGNMLRIQCSAGAVLSPACSIDLDAMIVRADLALYGAKEGGKGDWKLFEASMDAAFRSRQSMKADLRSTVEAQGLRVVYQPIISMGSMRISSCEALCRWDHPEHGPVSPAVFIPLAEEMGIISQISAFVVAQACTECAKWPEQVSVSVNLSAKDFRNRDVLDRIRDVLQSTGLAPHRLEIEVTETALLDDKAVTRTLLDELKALGVRIALDDFGTGYSSLSYLHTLPLDKVKIDRSFLLDMVRSRRSLELLKGIVNLSRPLGLSVTIEGVETFEQLRILAVEVKPDLVQGFLFGSALTASGIGTMSNTVWPFASEIRSASRAARR
jgi:diguanylate cyclase (GGDEF)-like protein